MRTRRSGMLAARRTRLPVAAAMVVLAAGIAAAGTYEAPLDVREKADARFTQKPTAERTKDGVAVTFAVSAATDVEVAVLDAKGTVVRHLAAGLLGKHAPAPLKRDSLKQELVWDGTGDLGEPATGGPFRVRVRLGATPKLEKYLAWVPGIPGPITSIAVGDGGEVYVLTRSWVGRGRNEILVFGRDGRYRRTVMPYSARTPAARTKSVGHLMVDGQRLPVIFSGHAHALSPLTVGMPRQTMAFNPKGHLVAVSTLATAFEHGLPRHLLAFDPQGGAPEGVSFVGPEIRPPTGITWGHGEGDDPCFDHLAVSPDGNSIYFTHSTFYNLHAVYRLQWNEDKGSGMEAAWLGFDNRPGSDDRHLNDPQGLAVDAQGRVYVCDRGNNRVVVASPDGTTVGTFPVEDPEQIAVHPKTGAIYVLCRQAPPGTTPKDIGPMSMAEYRAWKARVAERKAKAPPARAPKLIKFDAFKKGEAPRQLIRLDEGLSLMALDASGEEPRLWVVGRGGLRPLVDRGDRFESGDAIGRMPGGLPHPGRIVGDPDRNRALVYNLSSNYKVDAIDLTTGEKTRVLDSVSDFDVAPDGTIYGTGGFNSRKLLRFDANGKPLNFEGTDSNVVRTSHFWVGGINLGSRGMTVSPAGDIYLLRAAGEKGIQNRVELFGPDGKVKRAALIDGLGIGDCGIAVDPAGNVYLGANVKPRSRLFQDNFAKVPPLPWLCWAQWAWHYRPAPWYYSMRNEYIYHWGAVFKFGPEGGAFYGRGPDKHGHGANLSKLAFAENAPEGATDYRTGYLYHPVKAVGVKWRYAGMGIVPASERYWGDPACVCMTSRLAVDGFGRVFLPNCFRFCVEMTDTNGNLLARAGTYGNADDTGSVSHFAWPAYVDVAGGKVYVSDGVNRRLAVIGFDYADEQTCDVTQ